MPISAATVSQKRRDPCYHKYFVYLDDGTACYRVAIPAVSAEAAEAACAGNGSIVAVRDVTDDYPISLDRVSEALRKGGFDPTEIRFITRGLLELEIAE